MKRYQCGQCSKIHSEEEWMLATWHEICDMNGDIIEMERLRQLGSSPFDGDSWFTCPSCEEALGNDPENIIEINLTILKNAKAVVYLDSVY